MEDEKDWLFDYCGDEVCVGVWLFVCGDVVEVVVVVVVWGGYLFEFVYYVVEEFFFVFVG